MKNNEIAEIFTRMALLLEVQGEIIFKIRAYQKAAENIRNLPEDIATLQAEDRLEEIPGVGEALRDKISEYLKTGEVSAYRKLTEVVPETLLDIMSIPTVGPKKAKLFFDQLGIKDVNALLVAAEAGDLLKLPGVQQKTVDKILEGILILKKGQERLTVASADRAAMEIVLALKPLKEIKRLVVAGSLRRMKESVGDIDILIEATDPKKVMDVFVALPDVTSVNAHGETKSSVVTKKGVQVDLRIVEAKSFGAALLYFTGSKNFNVKLRQLAQKSSLKVNEYGIYTVDKDEEKYIAGKTEEECFAALGLPYIPPELREDFGEAEIFFPSGRVSKKLKLPKLVTLKDIQGDLHVHSTWSDGHCSIQEMAQAAQALGYKYIAVSDHSVKLKIAGGLSVEELKKKKAEIEKLNAGFKDFRVLFGTEVEVDAAGDIDYNDKVLSEFDVVIAAVHTGLEQDEKKMTARIIKAIKNKHVDILAHPTAVQLGKRAAVDMDFKAVCQAAVDYNTFLEINSFPVRFDLNSANVYFASREGARFSVNTDSHRREHLGLMKYGVGIARRGWLTKGQVVNTLSVKELLKTLKKGRLVG